MFLFVFVLLIAGGVIAYVGDRLGTYIGKKRLSAWGLRPRHTAMLWTVVSGGLIAVLTLFALIGYDRTVQMALLRGPELLEENQQLSGENRDARNQIRLRETQARAADARAADAQTRAQHAAQRAQTALDQALDAETRLHHSLTRLRTANSALGRSRQDLSQRQAQLAAARRRLTALNDSLGSTRADLRSAHDRLHAAQHAVQVAETNVKLKQTQYDHALGTVNDLEETGRQLSARNAALNLQNTVLSGQNTALDAKYQDLLTKTTFLQGAHLTYHKGQELGRRVIPTDQPAPVVRQSLVAFLNDLSHTAVRAGAAPGENGRAVRIVVGSQTDAVTEDEALDALAQSIVAPSGTVHSVVVIAAAHFNAFGGEPVQVEVQPYDNLLVFPAGAVIASTTVDGSLPEDKILDALRDFLKQSVQTAALRQGIIPRPDPETGEPTVGEPTDSSQTLALVKQIQRIGPGALVTARAAADAFSSGPLRLRLTAAPPTPVPHPIAKPPASTNPLPQGEGERFADPEGFLIPERSP